MWKWFMSILNCFVVVQGDTTITLGHEGMLVASQTPAADESGALMVPNAAL